jgi:hypothetical protein
MLFQKKADVMFILRPIANLTLEVGPTGIKGRIQQLGRR